MSEKEEMMKKIYEVIKEKENKIKDKDINKELIFKLDNEIEIIINNEDSEYEEFILIIREIMNLKILSKEDYKYYKGDLDYYRDLIKDIELSLYKLRKNMGRDINRDKKKR